MISQSENNIKKSALRFLKMYYKHRPRSGKTETKVDQSTKDGIIADGMLTFPQEDKKPFVASVEATSFDTRDEVKFKMQQNLLNWDSFMWGSFITSVVVLFGHYFHLFKFHKGDIELVAFLSILFVVVFIGYRNFFNKRAKYRYIYALQQFRQYHADEQWVAIGDNVFYGTEDPSFEELRVQCVKNGFGLLSIDKELNTHLVISPSREELFESERKVLSFMGTESIAQNDTIKQAKGWWGFLKSKLGFKAIENSLFRYQRKIYKPLFVSILMLGLIGFVAVEDLREKDMNIVENEEKYNEELSQFAKDNPSKKSTDQLIDSTAVTPFKRKRPDSYIAVVEKDKRDAFVKRGPLKKKDELSSKGGTEIFVEADDNSSTSYDCSRFFNLFGKKHLVQDGIYGNLEGAQKRMKLLRRKGVKANLLWLGCFYSDSNDYIVYIEWLYEDKDEAVSDGLDYRQKLKQAKIQESKLIVRSIEI